MYVPEEDVETMDEETYEETYEEDEENYEEGAEDDGESDAEGADADEPVDLADALGRVREMDGSDSSETMGGDGAGDDDEESESSDHSEEGSEYEEDYDEPGDDGDDGAGRGPAMQPDVSAYQDRIRQISIQANARAMQLARRDFQQAGIKELTMDDLVERRDGRIVYNNPDDPNRPFENRMQAQQWLDSFARQYRAEMTRLTKEYRSKVLEGVSAPIRMLQFAPTFNAMSPMEQQIMDDLIEGYEVRNSAGETVGYRCDLNAMAEKARALAAKYSKGAGNAKAKAKGPGRPKRQKAPATDMRSHGTVAGSGGNEEPKTIEDAMRMLHEMERKGRK